MKSRSSNEGAREDEGLEFTAVAQDTPAQPVPEPPALSKRLQGTSLFYPGDPFSPGAPPRCRMDLRLVRAEDCRTKDQVAGAEGDGI